MRCSILRDDSTLEIEGILQIPDYIDNKDLDEMQEFISEAREKYLYNGDGFTESGKAVISIGE